jgi:hypothetical protein
VSIESLIDDAGQFASITAEAPDGQPPEATAMGGADRSDPNWLTVADGVPCLVWHRDVAIDYERNDARASVVTARIYFAADTVPPLTSRHRITVTQAADDGPRVLGVYAVKGSREPSRGSQSMLIVEAERIRVP